MREPVIIDLASHYKGQLTGKIEIIKRAILEARLIEFDYYDEKGESHRRIEPYFIIFQWSSWYVFGFCLERQGLVGQQSTLSCSPMQPGLVGQQSTLSCSPMQPGLVGQQSTLSCSPMQPDWRMFKLLRLWNLTMSNEKYAPREIPPERRDFGMIFPDDIKLVAVFEPSERYKLIESYGLNCYTETEDGLRIEIGFTNRSFLIGWLLGFGGKVKVLEPDYIVEDIKAAAENILSRYR
jgi:predicted DNA-binding transcriptional regulator YafY